MASTGSSVAASNGKSDRTFSRGRGGLGIDPFKTAVLFIEFQNEFATEGGKLHGSVKDVMAHTKMLPKAVQLVEEVRSYGVKIFHAPITFSEDGSDNPNKHMGILAGCDYDKLFTRGTWNAQICDPLKPKPEDVVVVGKHGLSAFPNTNLEENLKTHGIETIAIGGFMANCCVESTMREACEKGFNVVTLTDCVATTSMAGYKAATEITYPFFSTPMNAASFTANVKAAVALPPPAGPWKRRKLETKQPTASWDLRSIGADVYQIGPWFVDVRQSAVGEKIVRGNGDKELRRYLTMAEASGMMGSGICDRCDAIYTKKMPAPGDSTDPFGWLCNATVVRLPMPEGGCLVYSPVLGPDHRMDAVQKVLAENDLLPVRIVMAPSPQHHLTLTDWQTTYPDAFFICGKASGQMPPLTRKRRDVRFDGVLSAGAGGVVLGPPVLDQEGAQASASDAKIGSTWQLLKSVFDVCVVDDNRSGELILRHVASKTLIMSDLLYKSNPDMVGPGGSTNAYTCPEWFAEGQEELFYSHPQDNSGGLLPAYRTHPRMRSIDIPGMRKSLDHILAWDLNAGVACHTDAMKGDEVKDLIKKAWAWVWN